VDGKREIADPTPAKPEESNRIQITGLFLFILFSLFAYGSSPWLDAWAFCLAHSGFDAFLHYMRLYLMFDSVCLILWVCCGSAECVGSCES
jgi:hypothetical protein